MSENQTLTAQQIADNLGGRVVGDPGAVVSAVEIIERATADHLTFVSDSRKLSRLKSTEAILVLAPASLENDVVTGARDITFILVEEPEVAFLQIAAIFSPQRSSNTDGTSSSAVVSPTAIVGTDNSIGHHVVIGRDVTIGQGCRIEHGTVIEDGCTLGDNVVIHANCVLYPDTIIGNDVTIHATCVIGADGFGYRTVNGRHERLPHYGIVRICDDVEIGAGTTIDRAKVGETVIGTGTRIDNQVMIGHNCHIGPHNLIVSQVGFAGSASTGSYVIVAGQAGIADHVHLGDGAIIGGKTGVHRNMKGGQSYFGMPALPIAEAAKNVMALRRLPEMRDTIKRLEHDVISLQQSAMASAAKSALNSPPTDSEHKAA